VGRLLQGELGLNSTGGTGYLKAQTWLQAPVDADEHTAVMICQSFALQEALIADKGEDGIEHSQSQSSMHSDSLPAGSMPPSALPASSPSSGDSKAGLRLGIPADSCTRAQSACAPQPMP
jgi:hypothetical protein